MAPVSEPLCRRLCAASGQPALLSSRMSDACVIVQTASVVLLSFRMSDACVIMQTASVEFAKSVAVHTSLVNVEPTKSQTHTAIIFRHSRLEQCTDNCCVHTPAATAVAGAAAACRAPARGVHLVGSPLVLTLQVPPVLPRDAQLHVLAAVLRAIGPSL